jgi:hypothetical protein
VSDKRIPKPGEVWQLEGTGVTSTVLNVYPECLSYLYNHHDVRATTIGDFLNRYAPPEPTVDLVEEVWLRPGFFYIATRNIT